MGYPCGGTPLAGADGGPPGRWLVGVSPRPEEWAQVTCPACRAVGHQAVVRQQHRQQHPETHQCTPEACGWMRMPPDPSPPQ